MLLLKEAAIGAIAVSRDTFLVLMISTCLAQVTKRTPNARYYFFFTVILLALSFWF